MSLFRSSKLHSIKSRFEDLRERLVPGSRKSAGQLKSRRLLIDPLEERQLLSLTPADWDDTMVNQTVTEDLQFTIASESVAADDDGDFVVTWTRYDPVLDSNGQVVIDPDTDAPMTDANIYARYFTDEVQRLTIPEEIVTNNAPGQYGTFSLIYGGSEVQKIDFSATHEPNTFWQQSITASVTYGFDRDGNGFVSPSETVTISYNEHDTMALNSSKIEAGLQGIGGALSDVVVSPVSPKEFLVKFGDQVYGEDQPKLTIEAVTFTSGFYPAVLTSTVREPFEIGPIVVSPDNPMQTATSIETSFDLTARDILIGPINFPPEDHQWRTGDYDLGPRREPEVFRSPLPGVSVRPLTLSDGTLSLTQFDLFFDGASGSSESNAGKKDHPELLFSAITDDLGTSYLGSPDLDVRTMKEPSPEFRVNPEEPEDIFTAYVDKFDQTNPAIAMDSDGDFVITWQSEISQQADHASIADIFARQFTPVGKVDPADVDFVPSVDAGEMFQVNTLTNGAQADPAIDMDAAGNFSIAWSTGGQDLSFFNGIQAQMYTRDGEMLNGEFQVNAEDTSYHWDPAVGVSDAGNVVITWSETDDEDALEGLVWAAVNEKVYNDDGSVRFGQIMVNAGLNGGGESAIAFDSAENFVISWSTVDSDRIGGSSSNVLAQMRQMLNNGVIRPTFRVNSSEFGTGGGAQWPGPQDNSQPGLDADGDLVVMYEGYGPAASESWVSTFYGSEFQQGLVDLFYQPEHSDLLLYYDPVAEGLPISSFYQDSNGVFRYVDSDGTVGGQIDQILMRAINQGASDNQLGRIRALLDQAMGLLRGEANGIMFSSWDADTDNSLNRLYSDCIANAQRDGENSRFILTINRAQTDSAAFGIRVTHPFAPGYSGGTFTAVYNNSVLNVGQTRTNLESWLQGLQRTGDTWRAPGSEGGPGGDSAWWDGTVEVRILQTGSLTPGTGFPDDEISTRVGTAWDLSSMVNVEEAVFEITLIGETHGLAMNVYRATPTNVAPTGAPAPRIYQINEADSGISQHAASIAVEPDGDFVSVWTQDEEYTGGDFGLDFSISGSNQNIYYRRFDEAIDQAGPRLTDLVNTSGDRVADGDFIDGEVRHIVLTFDEELMGGDPTQNPDSVFNPANFKIFRGEVEISEGVVQVEFGMNKAADLAGTPDGLGETYNLNPVPTNKWEAVLTLDADGVNSTNLPALRTGAYTIVPQTPAVGESGLRDMAGNGLGFSGYQTAGRDDSWNFVVRLTNPDEPITGSGGISTLTNGTTNPETPGAVAMDADGDHVVVWTAFDTAAVGGGHDRVYMRMLDADGSPADLIRVDSAGQPVLDGFGDPIVIVDAAPVLPVTPSSLLPEFDGDIQRHANVAMDADGDFVVTWTNYRGGDADVYARRFDSRGELAGVDDVGNVVFKSDATDAFQVNEYTDNQQKWSDVAMDLEGDFVVTWSSYGQEDNGQLGRGYGVYARQYNSTGQAYAPPFQVNVTTGGNQFSSSVAMAANALTTANSASSNIDSSAGDFVIVWTSNQNGIGMDIVAREFNADGSAKLGPLGGEIVMNDTREGDQTNPDVAMRLDGETYIVTWTDSAQDGSGNSVFAELSRAVPEAFVSTIGTEIVNVHNLTINVGRNFTISDIDIQLGLLTHQRLEDVTIELIHGGVTVLLSSNLPRTYVDGSRPPFNAMFATRFDQGADTRIIDSTSIDNTNTYTGRFVPEGGGGINLDNFNTLNAQGIWTLRITDVQPQNNLTGRLEQPESLNYAWRLIIEDENGTANSFQVNSTQTGHQLYSAAAMDYQGNFTITWGGKGDQPFQTDVDGYGVFYQRYDEFAAQVGVETRANRDTVGDQWMSSIASDAVGNFALAWTGVGSLPNTTEVYTYASVLDIPRPDAVGPVVTDMLFDGVRVSSGDFLVPGLGGVTSMTVVFNEDMSVEDGVDGLNSILNVDNWFLTRNDAAVAGGVADVAFELNPVTNKYEATITFDGNGPNSGAPALPEGDYSLAIRDLIHDVSVLGNQLDGDINGIPGSAPFQLGLGGYRHQFYVSSSPQIGAEMRINPEATKQYEQRFTAAGGVGFAREESNRTVGMDHDGDFVVVWTSYGQDDLGDAAGAGVYMRMYDRNNNPLTAETSVNGSIAVNGQEFIEGDQRNASVAMDADGEFVVVWESENQDADGSWGIYGKRYNSVGVAQVNPDWEMVQRLTFDTSGVTQGQFALDIGPDTTELITFDSTDPAGTAAAIEAAILALENADEVQLYPDVTVSLESGSDPFAFDIRFGGRHAGMVQPTIFYVPDSVPGTSVSVDDVSDDRYIFQINTEITGNQLNPAVAMDDTGTFVVVWATAGQDFSFFNDVRGQRFDRAGEPQGLEFSVNTNDLPGTNPPPGGSFEVNPAVAMSGTLGSFVVAWDLVTQQQNGEVLNSIVAARMFDSSGIASPQNEFRADTGVGSGGNDINRIARNPQLAMNDQGGFLMVWEAYSGVAVDGYDVHYRQFNAFAGTVSTGQVNMTQFTDHQVNPSVAVDADGDFSIVWNGNGAEPDELNPGSTDLWTDSDNRGVFVRSYHASAPGVAPTPVTVQSRVNRTEVGYQEFPSVALEPDGDMLVVWSGRGVGDQQGIFARRYDEATDTAGPRATELRLPNGRLVDSTDSIHQPEQFVVVFDEDLWTTGPDSVENVANWVLARDQQELPGRIVQVQFGLNKSFELGLDGAVVTNKWEAVLTLDGDPDEPGLSPLSAGSYELIVRHPVPDVPETERNEGQSGIRDAVGNPLQRTGFNPSGADDEFTFTVSRTAEGGGGDDDPVDPGPSPSPVSVTNGRTYPENGSAVAMDGDGDHVVALTATDDTTGLDRVFLRLYEANGDGADTAPNLFYVTTEPEFANDEQRNASVAADADGDFVVTWTNFRNGEEDIYARRFFANGDAMGPSFRVNTYTDNIQTWSDVAIDDDGDFVVTWSSYAQETNGQLGSGWGVYARNFDSFGQPQAPEFMVNVTTAGDQQFSSVAMSSGVGFFIAWTSDQNGVGDDIVGRLFKPDGSPMIAPLSGEVMINDTLPGNQKYPDVDITPNGNNVVITWTSTGQDGSGDGIYGQLIDVPLLLQGNVAPITAYFSGDVPQDFGFGNTAVSTLDIPSTFPDNFSIADVDFYVDIRHGLAREVEVRLISPSGTSITVFENVPRNTDAASDFVDTRFNDEAILDILDPTPGVIAAPFVDPLGYIPQQALSTFDGQLSSGTWRIIVQDTVQNRITVDDVEVNGTLENWWLELTRVPSRSGEFMINESTIGNQSYSSVAMNRQGAFTVAWSGQGDQEDEEDQSGSGVFYRRFAFSGEPLDTETRANVTTEGNQRFAAIDTDGEGNFAIVWTGTSALPGETDVYRFLSTDVLSVQDVDGPRVSDILVGNDRVAEGDVLGTNVNSMTVAFSEDLSTRDTGVGLDAILNPDNWIIQRNGSEIPSVITDITFGLNPATRKYEAELTFDGNGLDSGDQPLLPGEYTLTVRDAVNDSYLFTLPDDANEYFKGNSLDGDFDGSPGTMATGSGEPGFRFHFSVADEARLGPEFRVNQSPQLVQRISMPQGTGFAREENTTAVAMDHDGDFAAVWTSYGQDAAGGGGVYLRLYDRNDNPLTDEILVNTTVAGDQHNAAVAVDADGELIVVWQSDGQDPDGSSGIYARRFDSVGRPLSGEFRVNSNTTDDQFKPAVAMGNSGNFVVVWGTASQEFSLSNDIRGQRFDYRGHRIGSEFLVNDTNIPGVGGQEVNPAVAMDDDGNFVVAWDLITAQQNGAITDSVIMAKMFGPDGLPLPDATGVAIPEFQADTGTGNGGNDIYRTSRNPQLVMDNQGGFIIVWESFGPDDNGPDSFGVFFQEFDDEGAAVGDGQVNYAEIDVDLPLGEFVGHQVNPSVGVDANGDFAVVFNGVGASADPLDPGNPQLFSEADPDGVFIRHYDTTDTAIDMQSRVNKTETGNQHFPTIVMAPDGDHLVVWAGAGAGDRHGIFARRYDETADSVGPIVSDVVAPSGDRIQAGSQVAEPLPFMIVTFDENMATSGPESVTNAANYSLLLDGAPVLGMIKDNISYGLNRAYAMGLTSTPTNKWEAVLMVDGNGANLGEPALPEGDYELVAKNSLRDAAGNPLESTRNVPNGVSFSRQFNVMSVGGIESRVNSGSGAEYTQSPQTVASDADGDTVTVWVNETAGQQGVYASVSYVTWTVDADGDPLSTIQRGPQILVTGDQTAMYPSVATDGDGDFVVTWSQMNSSTDWDVYARRYDALGTPLGGTFMVNSEAENSQQYSTVAMDENGDFAITWQSFDQDGDGWGIYAQRYNPAGIPLGGSNEIQVLNLVGSPTGSFSLQWSGNVTGSIAINGNAFSIVDDVRNELTAIGAEAEVAAVSATEISVRFTGSQGANDQLPISVVNSSVTGETGAAVGMSTAIQGSSGEFLVNDTTANNQTRPTVAMDHDGNFVISWTGHGQDGDGAFETNIYAKQYPRNEVIRGTTTLPTVEQLSLGSFSDPFASADYLGRVSPSDYVVQPGSGFDGVGMVIAGGGFGTGTLLSSGIHVLTAAHVVTDPAFFGDEIAAEFVSVQFTYPNPSDPNNPIVEIIPAREVYAHPHWTYDLGKGYDIAIVELEWAPSLAVERFEIYRDSDELGKTAEMVGWGTAGPGDGSVTLLDGQMRKGLNRHEVTGSAMGVSDTYMFYDFDTGLAENDAFGHLFGLHDLGYGDQEVNAHQGDSGGPSFIDGKIAGVTSFSTERVGPFDVLPGDPRTFGDFEANTRVSLFADWIDTITASSAEFLVNQTVISNQQWSSVAMDAEGEFVISWTSYGQDGVGSGYGAGLDGLNGVFARRYSGNAPISDEFQVNTYGEGDQQLSRVSMDADGDFVVAWESDGQDGDGAGIYAQRFARSQRLIEQPVLDDQGFPVLDNDGNQVFELADPFLGPAGQIGGELLVNATTAGDQSAPGIALDDTGNFVVVWSGNGETPGEADSQGVFERRFEKSEDDAGPTVTDVFNVMTSGGQTTLGQLVEDPVLDETVSQFVLAFGENLSTEGLENGVESVLNPFNWELSKNDDILAGGIVSVEFGLSASAGLTSSPTNKYEAIVTFDGDPTEPGLQPLGRGTYVLSLNDSVEDLFENMLDGDGDGTPSGDFTFQFNVFAGTSGAGGPGGPGDPTDEEQDTRVNVDIRNEQRVPAVASNADGDHVVVWVRESPLDPATLPQPLGAYASDLIAQVYDRHGQRRGLEFVVASFASGVQTDPDVAMDVFGNFIVTWSGTGEDDASGVYARTFDAYGNPLRDQFLVNQTTANDQTSPEIAADANGDFVISWSSETDNLAAADIYARRFNSHGQPTSGEFMVNSTTGNHHETSDIAMDADGNFVVVWAAMAQDESSLGVFGQRYDAAGNPLGVEFRVNIYGHDLQSDPQVAMDSDGDFTVVWSSFLQDGSGWSVNARRYSSSGATLTSEFRVNETALYSQYQPSVSMDDSGRTVITWTSFHQDGDTDDGGIFARIFNADGSDYIDSGTTQPLGEFRVNANTEGDQTDSAVAMDSDGDFIVVWAGPDVLEPVNPVDPLDPIGVVLEGTGVFRRIVALNPSSYGQDGESGDFGAYTGRFVYAAAGVGTTVVNGTAGNDLFEVEQGGTPDTWVVKLNGAVQEIVSGANAVTFNGMGGYDTVNLVSLAAGENDSAELWSDHGTFTSAGVTFTLTDVDSINIDGEGGQDTVIIHDSANDDNLVARAVTSYQPVGSITVADYSEDQNFVPSYSHSLASFETLTAYSTEGVDVASFYDSDGDDKLVAKEFETVLSGPGFNFRAEDFQYTHAYAKAGGNDLAEMYDTARNDRFKADPTYARMFKGAFQRRAKFFETVVAYATGGFDDARLFDSASTDQFTGTPTESRLRSDSAGFDIRVMAFDRVIARSSGGQDEATFMGGAGNDLLLHKWLRADTLVKSPKTEMMDNDDPENPGSTYSVTARRFNSTSAIGGQGGFDIAKLWDTLDDDRFTADGNTAAAHDASNELLYDVAAFNKVVFNHVFGGSDTTTENAHDFILSEYWAP